jgi:hypothetical protein
MQGEDGLVGEAEEAASGDVEGESEEVEGYGGAVEDVAVVRDAGIWVVVEEARTGRRCKGARGFGMVG